MKNPLKPEGDFIIDDAELKEIIKIAVHCMINGCPYSIEGLFLQAILGNVKGKDAEIASAIFEEFMRLKMENPEQYESYAMLLKSYILAREYFKERYGIGTNRDEVKGFIEEIFIGPMWGKESIH